MTENHLIANLGRYQKTVDAALTDLKTNRIIERIWEQDHTVWKPEPTEISNRLGWLRIAGAMQAELDRLRELAQSLRNEGTTHALLLGMGGSSLAPEVFAKTFGPAADGLDLAVLDSTDPGAVLAFDQGLDPAKTVYIVSTKSGGTVETLSFFKYFYNRAISALGQARASKRFIAITDPGSRLADIAARYDFRQTFLNDPNIGGRYSALSFFGLVPAALVGLDVGQLLKRAVSAAQAGQKSNCEAAQLGVIMGELAKAGRDKLTLITSPQITSFGDWVEQLIAESTGKEGTGILPIVGEPLGRPQVYGDDRLFVYITLAGDSGQAQAIAGLEAAGQPVVRLSLADLADLGEQFFVWELATAVAGQRLNIQPFDQPNVESAKVLARQMVDAYHESGQLPKLTPILEAGGISVYGDVAAPTPAGALEAFVKQAKAGAYIAIQAYLQPAPETDADLFKMRALLRDQTHLPVTVGYGPRFLHSTGQLHKGDAGRGLFIQLTADAVQDAGIPDEAGKPQSAMSFQILKLAQAMGDRQALLDDGRQVLRLHLSTPNRLTELVNTATNL